MRHYQTVLILKPDLDEGHVDEAVEKITGFIEKYGGASVKLERWGKKRLAYRVRKNKFGYYLNWYHTADPAHLAEFEKELQLFDPVIKYLIIRLEERDLDRILKPQDEEAPAESSSETGSAPAPKSEKAAS